MDWLSERQLAEAVLDSLTASICVVGQDGTIVAVNETWRNFARENRGEGSFLGENYLEVCRKARGTGARAAHQFGAAIARVLAGDSERFEVEYPCHAPRQKRWFLARVTPLRRKLDASKAPPAAIISHQNVTDRKQLELRLRRLADTDELTGVANRRKFMTVATHLLEKMKSGNKPGSLVSMDIDHFKAINDTHGHAAGDAVLCFVVNKLRRHLRSVDIFARIGGEEFAMLLPDTDEWGAVMVAERMRAGIAAAKFSSAGKAIALTASFGVTAFDPQGDDVDAALRRADAALYQAKNEGRDKVRAFAPRMALEPAQSA